MDVNAGFSGLIVLVVLANGLIAAVLTIVASRRQDGRALANSVLVIFAWVVPIIGVIACTLWLAFAPARIPRL